MNNITQTTCTAYYVSLMSARQDLSATTTQVFKMALYDENAVLNADTTTYTPLNEVPSTGGYAAGGKVLTFAQTVTSLNGVAFAGFNDVTWTAATISAAGALIYNATNGVAIAVLYFGGTKSTTGTDFVVQMPANLPTTALLRLRSGAT